MQPIIRRRLLMICVAAGVALALAYGFMPKPVPVDTVKAHKGPMQVTIDEEGKTRVRERFIISAPVSGYMRRVDLKVGDAVQKGQAVAVLEPLRSGVLDPRSRAEAEASVAAAGAAVAAADERARAAAADADYARKNIARQKKLFEAGYIARDLFEQAEAEAARSGATLLSAEAAAGTARAELQRARASLRYSAAEGSADQRHTVVITSPAGGYLLKLQKESEGTVNAGEPLIDIGDPAKLEARVEVLSSDAVSIRPGTKVLLERWGGDSPLTGTVRVVEPAAFTKISSLGVEEQRVFVIADITSVPEEWKRLGDGYRVEAKFIIWEGADVLQVPASALFRKGDDWAVFTKENGRAHLRQLQTGKRNGRSAEVLSGLSEGAEVIIHPDDTVSDNVRVKLRR
ncbi:MAG: efflux RND transporter periplasmic adaptor subunit [Thermodesulfovibrionales bacterium]